MNIHLICISNSNFTDGTFPEKTNHVSRLPNSNIGSDTVVPMGEFFIEMLTAYGLPQLLGHRLGKD